MRKFTSPLGGFAVWFMNSLIEIRFFTISVCTFLQSNYCFRTDWRSSKINVTGLNCKFTLFTNISCPFLPISGHCEYFVTCFSKLNNDLSPRNLTTHLSTVFRDSQSYSEEFVLSVYSSYSAFLQFGILFTTKETKSVVKDNYLRSVPFNLEMGRSTCNSATIIFQWEQSFIYFSHL